MMCHHGSDTGVKAALHTCHLRAKKELINTQPEQGVVEGRTHSTHFTYGYMASDIW